MHSFKIMSLFWLQLWNMAIEKIGEAEDWPKTCLASFDAFDISGVRVSVPILNDRLENLIF